MARGRNKTMRELERGLITKDVPPPKQRVIQIMDISDSEIIFALDSYGQIWRGNCEGEKPEWDKIKGPLDE
jgi:hypothetical protein